MDMSESKESEGPPRESPVQREKIYVYGDRRPRKAGALWGFVTAALMAVSAIGGDELDIVHGSEQHDRPPQVLVVDAHEPSGGMTTKQLEQLKELLRDLIEEAAEASRADWLDCLQRPGFAKALPVVEAYLTKNGLEEVAIEELLAESAPEDQRVLRDWGIDCIEIWLKERKRGD